MLPLGRDPLATKAPIHGGNQRTSGARGDGIFARPCILKRSGDPKCRSPRRGCPPSPDQCASTTPSLIRGSPSVLIFQGIMKFRTVLAVLLPGPVQVCAQLKGPFSGRHGAKPPAEPRPLPSSATSIPLSYPTSCSSVPRPQLQRPVPPSSPPTTPTIRPYCPPGRPASTTPNFVHRAKKITTGNAITAPITLSPPLLTARNPHPLSVPLSSVISTPSDAPSRLSD